MVKFRGIDINIVSQLDAGPLPEFATTNPSGVGTHAICYVPVHPGSQIWFEYSIDGPHPPEAAYLFKLFINEQFITSWDCTDKHGYHGKTTYLLSHYPGGGGDRHLQRSGFRFTNQEEENNRKTRVSNDCIEIRIHRIEYRQRIRSHFTVPKPKILQEDAGKLRLIESGITDSRLPIRRYKYQLVDPIDEPYATFRYYYRDYEWLGKHGFFKNLTSTGSSFRASSVIWHDPDSSPVQRQLYRDDSAGTVRVRCPNSSYRAGCQETKTTSDEVNDGDDDDEDNILTTVKPGSMTTPRGLPRSPNHDVYIPLTDSEGSLSTMTCDSIEDLPSQVPRSPQHPNRQSSLRGGHQEADSPSGTTMKSPSPRKQVKKTLAIDVKTAQVSDDEVKKRPMSPFTSSGMLRRILGSASHSAPAPASTPVPTAATVHRFDPPHLDRPTQPETSVTKVDVASKHQHPRTGMSLMSFLSRHTGSSGYQEWKGTMRTKEQFAHAPCSE